ncbi:hypothetical protein M3Y97_00994100 [Aphelenchoides bicaudatus]|nr:hypothetical protein M3Y97_00994100 [Aphelenchoides bicaudatus]
MVNPPANMEANRNFVRLRGLPYSATVQEIRDFFGEEINVVDILIVNNLEGKPSGEAYVLLDSEADKTAALKKDQEIMGRRYIEVFTIGEVETDQVVRRLERRAAVAEQGTVRVRGLPFVCNTDDIKNFFKEQNVVEIVFGKEPGEFGRSTGEAYIRFESKTDAEQALKLNGQYLGRRYLEIYNVDGDAFETFKDQMNAPPRGPNGRPRPLAEVHRAPESWQSNNYGPPPQQQRKPDYSQYQGSGGYNNYDDPYASSNYSRPQGPPSRGPPPQMSSMQQRGPPRSYNPQDTYYGSYDPMANTRSASAGYGAPPQQQSSYQDYRYNQPQSYGQPPPHYGQSARLPQNDYHQQAPYRGGPSGGQNNGISVAGEYLTPKKIHMRGLPYRVTAREIEQFFSPIRCVEIKVGSMEDGRASGDGIIEFESEMDAREALNRDRHEIKSRYIELFSFDNAKVSRKNTYRAILSRNGGGYNDERRGGYNDRPGGYNERGGAPKPLFTGNSWWESV